jgi:hypothetical protein
MARSKGSLDDKARWMRDRHALVSEPISNSMQSSFAERHYAVGEIAELWNLSSDAVRKLFQDEPGVLVLGSQGTSHRRRYSTLRVPESVLKRVHRRMMNI